MILKIINYVETDTVKEETQAAFTFSLSKTHHTLVYIYARLPRTHDLFNNYYY